MNSLLFLGVAAVLLVLAALRNSANLRRALKRHSTTNKLLPQAISVLILSAQVSELLRTIEHVSIVNIVAALFMLAILVATKSGTGNEPG